MPDAIAEQMSEPPIQQRLKELRTKQGYSLEDLALRSGVSRAMLSKIERGATSPTIGLLCKISSALGVSLSSLVAEPDTSRCRHIRPQDMIQYQEESGITRTSLSNELPGWGLELVHFALPAGTTIASRQEDGHTCREVIHVTRGTLQLNFCGTAAQRDIHAGESFLIDGIEVPCTISNPTDAITEYIAAVDKTFRGA